MCMHGMLLLNLPDIEQGAGITDVENSDVTRTAYRELLMGRNTKYMLFLS